MVLARDQHLPGVAVEHGMVGTVVAKFHLHGLAADRETEELMAEAYPEDRNADVEKLSNCRDRVVAGLGVAGTVRQEDAVGLELERLFRSRPGRNDRYATSVLDQQAQDIVLDAVIVGDDVKPRLARDPVTPAQFPCARGPFVRLGAA